MENQAPYGAAAVEVQPSTELTLLNKELELLNARSQAQFALSPVGQALKQFEVNQRMGQMYAASNIVPKIYQNNAANCAIAVDMAIRMNANPIMVMQNLYIVNGHPAWSSKFLIATVNTSGRFEPLRFDFYTDGKIGKVDYYETEWNGREKVQVKKTFDGTKIDNLCCVAYTSERGSKTVLKSSVVSCRLAAQEGWWTKNQSKWPTMTEQMLRYRAAAFWISAYAPEYAMGFRTEEEQQDIVDVNYTDANTGRQYTERGNEAPVSLSDLAAQNAKRQHQETAAEGPDAMDQPVDQPSETPDFEPEDTQAPLEVDPATGEVLFPEV